jgi:hypothetical protein
MEYPNVPRVIGMIVSADRATLHELDTVYGAQDAYDILEIMAVDAHNRRVIDERNRDK